MIRDAKDDEAKIYMCQGPPGTGNQIHSSFQPKIFCFTFVFQGKSQTITGIVRGLLQVSV